MRAGTPETAERLDRFYSWAAPAYSWWARLPLWRGWVEACLPRVIGEAVLEVSFGPGLLLPSLAGSHCVFGIDLNLGCANRRRPAWPPTVNLPALSRPMSKL